MAELSVILPYCNEYPMASFTIQSIAQELRDRVDFEIIAINNYTQEVKEQGVDEDKGFEAIEASAKVNPWLKSLNYQGKLSHWQAKNMGIQASTGRFLWFCDAHCSISRDSVANMFHFYKEHHKELNGTIHLPLTYKLLESHRLIYKLVDKSKETGEVNYSFTGYRQGKEPYYQVPCMSTCGMMMSRELYDELGGWPVELGIYGGGENFSNFALAILGKTINIFNGQNGEGRPLFHHGEKRGYSWNYNDYTRNRVIATYMFGGAKLAAHYINHRKGRPDILADIFHNVLATCKEHREHIKARQVMTIQEWLDKQKGN